MRSFRENNNNNNKEKGGKKRRKKKKKIVNFPWGKTKLIKITFFNFVMSLANRYVNIKAGLQGKLFLPFT